MPQRKTTSISVAGSNEPSDSEDDNTPLKKKAKTSSSQSATSREQRPRTVSKKQAALNDDVAVAQSTKVQNLEKLLARAKKVAKSAKKSPMNDNISCESEEKDSEDDIGFNTSITQLPAINPVYNKMKVKKLRRTNITAEQAALDNPTKLTNRAFLTLARQPTCSPEPHDESHELEEVQVDEQEIPERNITPFSREISPSSAAYMGDRQSSPSSQGTSSMIFSQTPSALPTFHKKAKKTIAKFQVGVVITKRPKVADYEDTVGALLVRAMFDYEGLVSTHDAFPDVSLRHQWSLRCWKQALKDTDQQIELSERMIVLIKKRGSRIRGHVLACVRSQIIATYGFVRKTTAPAVARNQALYDKLILKGAFHHKDPNMSSGFAENKIISEILYLAWFEDKSSQGPVLSQYFNPIPLETLALIFTMIDFCLREWSTGAFLQASFYEKNVIHTHKIYRVEVATWSEINLTVTTNIRKKLFTRAMHNAGIVNASTTIISGLVGQAKDRVQTELDGRTGETDSELEEAPEIDFH